MPLPPALPELALKCGFQVLGKTLENAINRAFEHRPDKPSLDADELVQRHASYVERWSRHIQTYRMTLPVETDVATVPLQIAAVPRMFRLEGSGSPPVTEANVLQSDRSVILLAAPGAGKTTTLKRFARHFFVNSDSSPDFAWQVPILVIARDIGASEPIALAIARILGFPVVAPPEKGTSAAQTELLIARTLELQTTEVEKPDRIYRANFRRQRDPDEADRAHTSEEVKKELDKSADYRIGAISVANFVADLLNKLRALVLIDGIDEFPASHQEMLWRSIGQLNASLSDAKIVATCRSGDFMLYFEDVTLCELEPLSPSQVEEVAGLWVDNPTAFVELIDRLPYRDLASRPLFLSYLLTLFKNNQGLPERPRHVYERIVLLALDEWDRSKSLTRPSRYSGFGTAEKLEFLAHLSYHLTYRAKSKRFSHQDLVTAYQMICASFQLPRDEAVAVASEIETHTGLIVASGFEHYEFSHLSLQEYLCAHYLVRNPYARKLVDYLDQYPPPVAIATAMSSEPSAWFANLVLAGSAPPRGITSLIARLLDERPLFDVSETLGVAVLRLIFVSGATDYTKTEGELGKFILLPNVRESVTRVLESYRIVDNGADWVKLSLSAIPASDTSVEIPSAGVMSKRLYTELKPIGTRLVD